MNFEVHKDERERMNSLDHYKEINPESLLRFPFGVRNE